MKGISRDNTILPDWAYRLRRGDILRKGTSYRIVRRVTGTGNSAYVNFSINRCSWTGACYTCYQLREVVKNGYRPTGLRASLKSELDSKIEHDIGRYGDERKLTCCDVDGIF